MAKISIITGIGVKEMVFSVEEIGTTVGRIVGKSRKQGAITIEFIVGTILSLAIVFLILGMFSANLKAMSEHSRLANLFNNNNTKQEKFNRDQQTYDAKEVIAKSQFDTQIVADQGNIKKKDDDGVIKDSNQPPEPENLSYQQQIDLAKILTIKMIKGETWSSDETEQAKQYNIDVLEGITSIPALSSCRDGGSCEIKWKISGASTNELISNVEKLFGNAS